MRVLQVLFWLVAAFATLRVSFCLCSASFSRLTLQSRWSGATGTWNVAESKAPGGCNLDRLSLSGATTSIETECISLATLHASNETGLLDAFAQSFVARCKGLSEITRMGEHSFKSEADTGASLSLGNNMLCEVPGAGAGEWKGHLIGGSQRICLEVTWVQSYVSREIFLGLEVINFFDLDGTTDDYTYDYLLWKTVIGYQKKEIVKSTEMETLIESWYKDVYKIIKSFDNATMRPVHKIANELKYGTADFKVRFPFLKAHANESILDRHWDQLFAYMGKTKKTKPAEHADTMHPLEVPTFSADFAEPSTAAAKEHGLKRLKQGLGAMEKAIGVTAIVMMTASPRFAGPTRFSRLAVFGLPLSVYAAAPEDAADPGRVALEVAISQGEEDTADLEPTTLEVAIRTGDGAAALQLLQQPQAPGLNEVDFIEWTLLHWAIFSDLAEVAVALVRRADFQGINTKGQVRGRTALHMAASKGLLGVCQAILDREDFTALLAVDSDGQTASEVADENGHPEVREFLGAAKDAADSGRVALEVVISRGEEDAADPDPETIRRGDKSATLQLLQQDSTELLAVDSDGQTASEVANEGGHREVKDFLRAAEDAADPGRSASRRAEAHPFRDVVGRDDADLIDLELGLP